MIELLIALINYLNLSLLRREGEKGPLFQFFPCNFSKSRNKKEGVRLNKSQRIRKNISKCNFCLHFPIKRKLLVSAQKKLITAELQGCVKCSIHFPDRLYVRYNCSKFHHYRICVTDFKQGFLLAQLSPPGPTSMSSPEKAHPE